MARKTHILLMHFWCIFSINIDIYISDRCGYTCVPVYFGIELINIFGKEIYYKELIEQSFIENKGNILYIYSYITGIYIII